MEKVGYIIEKCKRKAAYKAKPIKRIKLDIEKVKKVQNAKIISDAKIAVVLDFDGEQVIVQEYGTVTFKTLKNKEKIKEIAEKIYHAGAYNGR